MRLSTNSNVPVYTIAGSSTARPLPEWLVRKRKRSLKKDPEFANRVELLQDFEFEEASSCVRASEDGNWVMSTGTYKPQIHVHNLPQLSLSFSRHTESLNHNFILISSDYSKSIHLQADRLLQFHTPAGCHHSVRIPRYGRDLIYDRRTADTLIPATGVNTDGNGEVFRLNLELGRFMKSYEIDVGGDGSASGAGSLQGAVQAGSVNAAAIAEKSHNLLAFGTSLNTVEFWDSRSRNKAGILTLPSSQSAEGRSSEVTTLKFHSSGLTVAAGDSTGIIYLYDLRSPTPLLKKDQGFGLPIKSINFLESSSRTRDQTTDPKIMTADKRIIKIWDARDGSSWTSVQPEVDLNHVEWCTDSGMILTANEGRQQHAFFVPQLGPAPKWCAFLDNLVEEMAEDSNDPNAYGNRKAGEIYDNFKFVTMPQLRVLNIDHLIGRTSLLRPYMHGYFVSQNLYEEANLISNPDYWQDQRAKTIQQKIEKERESRIRGKKNVQVKVNKRLVERMQEREEKNERRKAKRVLAKGGDEDTAMPDAAPVAAPENANGESTARPDLLSDTRFTRLFEDEDFEIDERSKEFSALNAGTVPEAVKAHIPKGLTAAEEEEVNKGKGSSASEQSEDDADEGFQRRNRPQSQAQKRHNKRREQPQMLVTSATHDDQKKPARAQPKDRSFGSRAAALEKRKEAGPVISRTGVGEKEITFIPRGKEKRDRKPAVDADGTGRAERRGKDRRSASGNVFRRM